MKQRKPPIFSGFTWAKHPIALWLLCLPLGWATGLSLVLGGWLAVVGIARSKPTAFSDYAIIFYVICLMLSIMIAGVFNVSSDFAADRVVAAIYNIVIVIFLYISYKVAKNLAFRQAIGDGYDGWRYFRASSNVLFLLSFVFVAGCWVIGRSGVKEISVPSLVLGHLGSLPGILSLYGKLAIVSIDYTESSLPRPFGFGIYHTEGALIAALAGAMAANSARKRSWAWILHAATLMVLIMTASRTITAFWLVGLLGSFATTKSRAMSSLIKALILPAFALTILVVFGTGLLESKIDEGLSYRAGSSATRLRSYSLAIDMVMMENPWTGLGVKPRDSNIIRIPIGSHSTFISSFTKGGVLGLIAFAVFYVAQISILSRAVLTRFSQSVSQSAIEIRKAGIHGSAIVLGWMITEDMDAAVNGSIFAFVALGLLAGVMQAGRRPQRATRVPNVPGYAPLPG